MKFLILILYIWAQDVWSHYDIEQYASFSSPIQMEEKTREAITSLGTLYITTFVSESSDLPIEYSFSHYTYPEEVAIMLKESPSLQDTLLLSVPENIAIQNEAIVEYSSLESFGNVTCLAYRIKLNESFYQKGRALIVKDKMLIQQISADTKQLLSYPAEKYFKSLSLKD